MQAYVSEADVIYYGGAAGGGKSELLLGLSITEHKKSIIFRREYKQLRELIDRSSDLLAETGAKFSQTLNRWVGIPGNRVLEFGAVQLERDKENFKGRPHDFIGFDELPDFTETQFTFLTAWNRTTDPGQRTRIVGAGNPPTTPEGRWVIRYWAPWLRRDHSNPAKPGELRFFVRIAGKDTEVEDGSPYDYHGETLYPKSRTFIPARVQDNPYFDGTGYLSQLQSLPEPLRSQMLLGDFFISEEPQISQVIPTDWVRQAQARWREDDFRAYSAITDCGVDPSRGGNDQTVFSTRTGNYFRPLNVFEGREVRDGQTCVGKGVQILGPEYTGTLKVDIIGIGASAFDIFTTSTDYYPIDVNFSAKSYASDETGLLQMRNMRAEAYWTFREALDPKNGLEIALPPDEELVEDLTTPTWALSSQGVLVEDKEQIRKRLGRSPGRGDAVVLCYLDTSSGVFFK